MHSDPEILEPPLQRRRLGPVDEPVLPPLPDVMPEDVSPVPTSPASNMVPEDVEPLEIDGREQRLPAGACCCSSSS